MNGATTVILVIREMLASANHAVVMVELKCVKGRPATVTVKQCGLLVRNVKSARLITKANTIISFGRMSPVTSLVL